jgi:hypothetical protein
VLRLLRMHFERLTGEEQAKPQTNYKRSNFFSKRTERSRAGLDACLLRYLIKLNDYLLKLLLLRRCTNITIS